MSKMSSKRLRGSEESTKEMSEETIVWMKDSFSDRICDDLTEVILNYLSIEDKLRLNCVSKQFRRCLQTVLNRQSVLNVNSYLSFCNISDCNNYNLLTERENYMYYRLFDINVEKLTKLLKQMTNIREISFPQINNSSEVLNTITDNCNDLQTIKFYFDDYEPQVMQRFVQKYNKSLKSVKNLGMFGDIFQQMVNKYLNLESINGNVEIESIDTLLTSLSKIKTIYIDDRNVGFFQLFLSNIPNISKLEINFNDLNENTINDCIQKLSQMPALVELSITIISEVTTDVMKSFKSFSNLKKLLIFSDSMNVFKPEFNINFIKTCKQLTHLVIDLKGIDDNFFTNIESVVPHLRSIHIRTESLISDKALISLSILKDLKNISLESSQPLNSITDLGIKSLADNCIHLYCIDINRKCNITEDVFKHLIQKANNCPKIQFNYCLNAINDTIAVKSVLKLNPNPFRNISIN